MLNGIHVVSVTKGVLRNCTPALSCATRNPDNAGGAVYAASTARLDGCVFSNNFAALGSAVSNVVNFALQDTTFSGNALLCDDTRSFLSWAPNVSLEGGDENVARGVCVHRR